MSDAEAENSDPYDSDEDKAPSYKRVSAIQVAPSPVSSIHFFPVKEVPVKKGAKGAAAEEKKQKEPEEVEQQHKEEEEKPVFNDYSFWRAPLLDLDLTGVECNTEDEDEEDEEGNSNNDEDEDENATVR